MIKHLGNPLLRHGYLLYIYFWNIQMYTSIQVYLVYKCLSSGQEIFICETFKSALIFINLWLNIQFHKKKNNHKTVGDIYFLKNKLFFLVRKSFFDFFYFKTCFILQYNKDLQISYSQKNFKKEIRKNWENTYMCLCT